MSSNGVKRAKKLDQFCWKCHKRETNICCNGCERSFHNKCISLTKNIKDLSPNWVCNECLITAEDMANNLDSIKLQQILLMSLKMISKSADYYFNSLNCFADKRVKISPNLIVNQINLKKIEDKVKCFEYQTFRQMVSDFKWFLHNSIVGQLESELLENAKFLLSKAKQELRDFEECVHCFINYYKTSKFNYYSWFSKPCPKLHPLVWAKVRGHPYWPSKVIKINNQNSGVLVRFFGTHQKSWVKEKDCYLISEESPKQLVGKGLQMEKLLNSAVEELKYNIRYLKEEYPNHFSYSPKMSPFLIKDLPNSYNSLNTESNDVKNKEIRSDSNKTNDNNFPNRPIGWKPKARKTFPTPANSSVNKPKINDLNSIESSNSAKNSKLTQNIEIIEFKSLPSTDPKIDYSSETKNKRMKSDFLLNIEEKQVFEAENSFVFLSQRKDIKVPKVEPMTTLVFKPNGNDIIEENVDAIKQNISEIVSKADESLVMNEILNLSEKIKHLENEIKLKDILHNKQILEMQEKSDLAFRQMKYSLESDKQKALIEERNKQISINNQILNDLQKNFEIKTNQLIEKYDSDIKCLKENFEKQLKECKTKIWCYRCLKEAQLYCCSHTYYCSNECQLEDWEQHKSICVQQK